MKVCTVRCTCTTITHSNFDACEVEDGVDNVAYPSADLRQVEVAPDDTFQRGSQPGGIMDTAHTDGHDKHDKRNGNAE